MDALLSGLPDPVAEGVVRLLAPNPSAFTFWGTWTYLVGSDELAVVDPGPDMPEHVEAILEAARGRRISAILCTHTHRDHSPASRPLAAATGAEIVGCAPLTIDDEGPRLDASFDPDYRPDRILGDGERHAWDGFALTALATPGHTSNHLCFALDETGLLFTGDHIMGWSTTIVSPPDGDMADYLASLDRLLGRADRLHLPAHGPEVEDPEGRVRELIDHRRLRERQILDLLATGPRRIESMVPSIYRDIDPGLHPAAARSVLAHLIDLERRGVVIAGDGIWTLGR